MEKNKTLNEGYQSNTNYGYQPNNNEEERGYQPSNTTQTGESIPPKGGSSINTTASNKK